MDIGRLMGQDLGSPLATRWEITNNAPVGTDHWREGSPVEEAHPIGCLGGAELWRFPLDVAEGALQAHWESLSRDERARADRMRSGPRERFVAARGQLRRILARYLRLSPSAIAIGSGRNGKPFVAAGPSFNLSHSGRLGICAVSTAGEVGVDIEVFHAVPEAELIAGRWLGAAAATEVGRAGPDRDAVFLRHWTRREAYLKALGIGITDAEGPSDPAACTVFDLEPAPGYVGALAVARPGRGGDGPTDAGAGVP